LAEHYLINIIIDHSLPTITIILVKPLPLRRKKEK